MLWVNMQQNAAEQRIYIVTQTYAAIYKQMHETRCWVDSEHICNKDKSTPLLSILFFSFTLFIYIDKMLGTPYITNICCINIQHKMFDFH